MEKEKPIRDMTRKEFESMALALLTITNWKPVEAGIYEGKMNDWIFFCGESSDNGVLGYLAVGLNTVENVKIDFPERIAEALFKRIGRTTSSVN